VKKRVSMSRTVQVYEILRIIRKVTGRTDVYHVDMCEFEQGWEYLSKTK
jgi:hypothetical protein